MGVTSKMRVMYLSPYGVWRHTCSSTPMTRTPSHRVGSLISERSPSARTAVLAALPGHAQGLGNARHRHMMNDHAPPAPSAPPPVRASRADRPLDSYPDATRENTPGTGSGARSRAQSWDTTRRAHAPSAGSPCHEPRPGTHSVDTTNPHQQCGTPTLHGLATCAGPSPPGPGHPGA